MLAAQVRTFTHCKPLVIVGMILEIKCHFMAVIIFAVWSLSPGIIRIAIAVLMPSAQHIEVRVAVVGEFDAFSADFFHKRSYVLIFEQEAYPRYIAESVWL